MSDLSLAATRAELVADLRVAGYAVTEHPEQTVNAPAVLVAAPTLDDLISEGDTFDRSVVVMRLELFLLPEISQGDAFIEALTTGVQGLLLAIDDRWKFGGASGPFRASNLGGQIAIRVRVSTTAKLEAPGVTP